MKTAYIITGFRTAVGKAKKGSLRFFRPEIMGAKVIERIIKEVMYLDKFKIDDLIVGCAMPEGEQGLNIARFISLVGLKINDVPAVTVNRYCASGSEAIAIATSKIQSGMADYILAGGIESMSYIPMGGYKSIPNTKIAKKNPSYYWKMGLTAEAVAKEYNISRLAQDEFAYESHKKAIRAIKDKKFKNQIVPLHIKYNYFDENKNKLQSKQYTFSEDEGPRKDTSLEILKKLKPVFTQGGTITAGNSSQMSDGAAFVLIVSKKIIKKFNLQPIARLVSYVSIGLEPRIMGVGPIYAIPKALKKAGLSLNNIDLIELNEAFASQSLAIINKLKINPQILNVNGGAIALGHPMGCTGTKLTIQLINELKLRKKKYGIVSMCVGTGQGSASVFEIL